VAARADEKPLGCIAVLFKDAVKAVFIAAFRANLERVFELDLFYFSIHFLFQKIPWLFNKFPNKVGMTFATLLVLYNFLAFS
jgi:hypothetical protein